MACMCAALTFHPTLAQDFDEIKSLIRNTERLFPADLVVADAKAIRALFVRLKRENRMKKLAAEVELKIRAIYFNRIKPESVEGIVKVLYTRSYLLCCGGRHCVPDLCWVGPPLVTPPRPLSPPLATSVHLRGDYNAGGHQVLALLCHPAVPTNGIAGVPENALSSKLTAPR